MKPLIQKLFHSFRANLLAGALALTPLAAVIWIVAWFWQLILGVRDLFPERLDPRVFFDIHDPFTLNVIDGLITITLLASIVLIIAIVGLVSRNIMGKRLLKVVNRFVNRIPVLRAVYSTLEQLLQTFAGSQGKNFSKVVVIEYPRPGIYTLALVTGERQSHPFTGAAERCFNVFVPTTPNPTSGFFLTVPASDAKDAGISVEEALKQIISMGMVHGPQN